MVDKIKTVDPDRFRVQRRDQPRDQRHSQQQESEEEKDQFATKANYSKVLPDEGKQKPSLWGKRPAAQPDATSLQETADKEFTTSVSTISFLRAIGIISTEGHPRWILVGLYSLALIGVVVTTLFLLRMLL